MKPVNRPYFVPSPFLLVIPLFVLPVEAGAVLAVASVAFADIFTVAFVD